MPGVIIKMLENFQIQTVVTDYIFQISDYDLQQVEILKYYQTRGTLFQYEINKCFLK